MDVPKIMKDYCKKCNSHTEHKVKLFKSGKMRTMSMGQRRNQEKKRGYGGKYQFTAIVKKQNKRPTFVMECSTCKTKHYFVIPKRMKKVELTAN